MRNMFNQTSSDQINHGRPLPQGAARSPKEVPHRPTNFYAVEA